ncbi:MAG: TRAP transporter substrate-binding protein DctP [Deltaproteobacteria bacterium]|nr:TRAP transporter substrate-binding protein DctP [Deltaproteobacteria bacterium]
MRSVYASLREPVFVISLLAAIFLFSPGPAVPQARAANQIVLRIATAVPRTASSARYAKKGIKRLEQLTNNRITARVYWGGAAGDEETVLRKMRLGQVDASYLGLDIIRNFVPQAMVMGAPQTYTTYQQVDAVREALTPEFNRIAYSRGFIILSWGDAGILRIFSVKPIKRLKDFARMRPWVYRHSPLLKQFYRLIGCSGVPIGLNDVYSALQSGLVDVVWGSALTTSLMRWHVKTEYVSEPTGLLQGGAVITRRFWDTMGERDRKAIVRMVEQEREKLQEEMRDVDDAMYKRLLRRGIKPVNFERTDEWLAAGKRLREKMVGRLYSREILSRVEKIIAQYPDRPGTPESFR